MSDAAPIQVLIRNCCKWFGHNWQRKSIYDGARGGLAVIEECRVCGAKRATNKWTTT